MWNMNVSHKSRMMDRGVPLISPKFYVPELLAFGTKSFIISDMNAVMYVSENPILSVE